jgi:hypothetical protein
MEWFYLVNNQIGITWMYCCTTMTSCHRDLMKLATNYFCPFVICANCITHTPKETETRIHFYKLHHLCLCAKSNKNGSFEKWSPWFCCLEEICFLKTGTNYWFETEFATAICRIFFSFLAIRQDKGKVSENSQFERLLVVHKLLPT